MNHCSRRHVYSVLLDGLLVGVINARLKERGEIQVSQGLNIAGHFVEKVVHRRKAFDVVGRQEPFRLSQEDDDNILKNQAFNSILMVQARLHFAITNKLGDGWIVDGFVGRLTFAGGGDLVRGAFFFMARSCVFIQDLILVDSI